MNRYDSFHKRVFADHWAYFEKEGYSKVFAVFLASIMVIARDTHPIRNPLDKSAIDRVAPDMRLLQPIAFVQSSTNESSPLRDGYEWGYPF